MSRIRRRPNREKIKAERKQYKKAQKTLRQDENAKGLQKASHGTILILVSFENFPNQNQIKKS
jgi:hypothetical protein